MAGHDLARPPPRHPVSTHDTTRIDDTRIKSVRPLITPAHPAEWLPPPEAAQRLVESSRAAISRVLHGQDDRLIVVVGPCSIHDHEQAMEYARLLQAQAAALSQELLVVMRVLREATHHRRLEGLHQRPTHGRQLRHQRRAGNGARAGAGRAGAPACPWAPSFLTCFRRSTSATW